MSKNSLRFVSRSAPWFACAIGLLVASSASAFVASPVPLTPNQLKYPGPIGLRYVPPSPPPAPVIVQPFKGPQQSCGVGCTRATFMPLNPTTPVNPIWRGR